MRQMSDLTNCIMPKYI